MSLRFVYILLTIIAVLLIIDVYVFKAFYSLFHTKPYFRYIKIIHWGVLPFVLLSVFMCMKIIPFSDSARSLYYVYFFTGILILFYAPKILLAAFHLTEDVVYGITWIISKIRSYIQDNPVSATRISIISLTGCIFSGVLFLLFLKGMVTDRFKYSVIEQQIVSKKIPPDFNNFKIVQISDIHVGCYYNNEDKLEKAVKIINSLDPDVIVFTGDLVINLANEVERYKDIIKKLNARYGKFSVLGNHDYGEYYNWKTENDKKENLEKLIEYHKKTGFELLLNQNTNITINNDTISIIGIENWGLPPFPQYGDLKRAMSGSENASFKVLLSHDPSHWEEEVTDSTNIDLTLSGHTHGMQFGIYTDKIKWSPIKLRYKKWGGLYNHKDQYLYVNVGLGSIGFPGRVGVLPEITVFHLKNN